MPQPSATLQLAYYTPQVNFTCDASGDILLKPTTGDQSVIINSLILNGCDTSGCPTATIAADVSGNLNLTPASGAKCNLGGVVTYTNNNTQYIQSNGFSNLCIGNSDENSIAIQTTNIITLNGLEIASGTTIQPVTSTDSITVSAASINFTPSCGYLQMSQTPYYYNTGSGQSFNLPASGVYILSMAANDNSYAACLTSPQYTDSWMVFSSGSSCTAYPYSTEAAGTTSYSGFNGATNDIIGITTSSSANSISIQIDNSAGYFYYFFLTKLV